MDNCTHSEAEITRRVFFDRTFKADGKIEDGKPHTDPGVTWHCLPCDIRGNAQAGDPGVPRWVAEHIAAT